MNEDFKSLQNQALDMKEQIQELLESIACFANDISLTFVCYFNLIYQATF